MYMSRKAYFNQEAETWDQKYCTPELEAFLEEIVPMFGLKLGQRVLDLGTGTGALIPSLIRAVGSLGSVTAIDYAENMIQRCRAKYSHLKNVTIQLQDVEELDLPSESFDVVTCFGLFPHLENKGKALRHMNSVLKRGGRLIIAHALSSAEITTHHRDVSSAVNHDMLPEEEEMRQILKHAGFNEIYIRDEPGCYLCLSTKS
jgi:2-polyprenyl-3-methyl-5-hydroxy-6-metoxy-1,4-benzoquinol methylase